MLSQETSQASELSTSCPLEGEALKRVKELAQRMREVTLVEPATIAFPNPTTLNIRHNVDGNAGNELNLTVPDGVQEEIKHLNLAS